MTTINPELQQFILDVSKLSSYTKWSEAINYCQKYPGQHFVHHKLTLSYKHGLFHIDIPYDCIRVKPDEVEEYLNTNYPFSEP